MRSRRIEKRVDPRTFGNHRAGPQRVEQAPALNRHFLWRVRVVNVVRSRYRDRSMRQLVDRMNADVARRLAKADQAPARGKARNRSCEGVLADGVEDHIDPTAGGEVEDSRTEVLPAGDRDVIT